MGPEEAIGYYGKAGPLHLAPGQRAQVDVSSFAQGMYSVSCIRDGVKITTVKFVKQ